MVLLQPGCQNDSSPISLVVGDRKAVPGRPLRGLVMSSVAVRKRYFTGSANVGVLCVLKAQFANKKTQSYCEDQSCLVKGKDRAQH